MSSAVKLTKAFLKYHAGKTNTEISNQTGIGLSTIQRLRKNTQFSVKIAQWVLSNNITELYQLAEIAQHEYSFKHSNANRKKPIVNKNIIKIIPWKPVQPIKPFFHGIPLHEVTKNEKT